MEGEITTRSMSSSVYLFLAPTTKTTAMQEVATSGRKERSRFSLFWRNTRAARRNGAAPPEGRSHDSPFTPAQKDKRRAEVLSFNHYLRLGEF